MKLTNEQIAEIEYFGKRVFGGDEYTCKDYLYKSMIYKNGKLYAMIDNKKNVLDESRIEYMRKRLETMPFDHAFWLDDLHEELCHATGYEVFDEETGTWWNEYVDSRGNLHYGG